MILTYLSTTVDIGPAQYPRPANTELVQASDRSASGVVYVEDFSLQIDVSTYNFVNMHDTQYVNLMQFFVNEAQGKLNVFTLTDDLGQVYTVRFTESRLSFTHNAYRLWNGSFSVESA